MESQTTSGKHIESMLAGSVIAVFDLKESFLVVICSCAGEIFVSTSLQWTTADSSMSASMVSLLLQAVKAIVANAMYRTTKMDEEFLKIFDGEHFVILIATTCNDVVLKVGILYCLVIPYHTVF